MFFLLNKKHCSFSPVKKAVEHSELKADFKMEDGMMNISGVSEKITLSKKERMNNWTCVYLDIVNSSKDKYPWKVFQYKL